MKSKKEFISKRLAEVWAWKDAVHGEVKDLPTDQALDKIIAAAHATAKKYKRRYCSTSSVCAVRGSHKKYNK
ncbi:MAG: hypothetical protein WCQ99_01355 [Pseudomonadota bacterium]